MSILFEVMLSLYCCKLIWYVYQPYPGEALCVSNFTRTHSIAKFQIGLHKQRPSGVHLVDIACAFHLLKIVVPFDYKSITYFEFDLKF